MTETKLALEALRAEITPLGDGLVAIRAQLDLLPEMLATLEAIDEEMRQIAADLRERRRDALTPR